MNSRNLLLIPPYAATCHCPMPSLSTGRRIWTLSNQGYEVYGHIRPASISSSISCPSDSPLFGRMSPIHCVSRSQPILNPRPIAQQWEPERWQQFTTARNTAPQPPPHTNIPVICMKVLIIQGAGGGLLSAEGHFT